MRAPGLHPATNIRALLDEARTAADARLYQIIVEVAGASGKVGAVEGVSAMWELVPYAANLAAPNPDVVEYVYRYPWALVV